jgi:hypothetical protein
LTAVRNSAQHLVALVAQEVGFVKSPERGGQEITAIGKERLGRDVGGHEQESRQSEDVTDAAGNFIVPSLPFSCRHLRPKPAGQGGANDVPAENVRQDSNRVGDDQAAHAVTDE